ncbi:MAG: HlyD family efflux transporter periplasmic adaptor subunit [Deltaproteobacteria bacterium]|nr:HlyD family efflux transporter periplasmic adaptor subunit [Candidatus Anaeroferrophillus wilburensis]MBN2889115.1 HlyD family efflux transporter periplasmic adaptor subunit [Deltaproteobacteria bacterium]
MAVQWRKYVFITIGIGLVVLGIVYGFWPRPVMVETAAVERGPLTVTIAEEGKARVVDRYLLSAPIAGFVRRLTWDVGDKIGVGERVAELLPLTEEMLDRRSRAQAEAKVAAARAALQATREQVVAARAAMELAQVKEARLQQLVATDSAARESLDEAESRARTSEAALRSAEFMVQVAGYELEAALAVLQISAAEMVPEPREQVVIKAPAAGRVLAVYHESAGVVGAGEALLEVGDPRSLEVEVDLLSADAVRVAAGTPVIFEHWGGEDPLHGVVKRVEPRGFTKISALGVEEQRVLVIVDFTSSAEEWERLGDGYRLDARFILWHDDDVLQVPSSSLFREAGRWAVFVVERGRARQQLVEVGRHGGLQVQILAGLAEGQQVIIHPSAKVEAGRRIARR